MSKARRSPFGSFAPLRYLPLPAELMVTVSFAVPPAESLTVRSKMAGPNSSQLAVGVMIKEPVRPA